MEEINEVELRSRRAKFVCNNTYNPVGSNKVNHFCRRGRAPSRLPMKKLKSFLKTTLIVRLFIWKGILKNPPFYYMAKPVLGKSLCSDWFFLGQDFAVRTISMETVQPVYFCFGAKPANSKFATKQRKKTVNIVILHNEPTRRS